MQRSVRSYKPVHQNQLYEAPLKRLPELINKAKKPFIVFGQGVILGEAEEQQLKALV